MIKKPQAPIYMAPKHFGEGKPGEDQINLGVYHPEYELSGVYYAKGLAVYPFKHPKWFFALISAGIGASVIVTGLLVIFLSGASNVKFFRTSVADFRSTGNPYFSIVPVNFNPDQRKR